jgi:hypothetical protein
VRWVEVDRKDIVFYATFGLFMVFTICVGAKIVATAYNVLQDAFPALRNTVFGINIVVAIASFFVITTLNIYLRLLNKMITGEFYKRISAREWIIGALRENKKIILVFMLISAIFTIIFTSFQYAMLVNQKLEPLFGIYQDVATSGTMVFATFELWIITYILLFYDLIK